MKFHRMLFVVLLLVAAAALAADEKFTELRVLRPSPENEIRTRVLLGITDSGEERVFVAPLPDSETRFGEKVGGMSVKVDAERGTYTLRRAAASREVLERMRVPRPEGNRTASALNSPYGGAGMTCDDEAEGCTDGGGATYTTGERFIYVAAFKDGDDRVLAQNDMHIVWGTCSDNFHIKIHDVAGRCAAWSYDGSYFSRIDSGIQKCIGTGFDPRVRTESGTGMYGEYHTSEPGWGTSIHRLSSNATVDARGVHPWFTLQSPRYEGYAFWQPLPESVPSCVATTFASGSGSGSGTGGSSYTPEETCVPVYERVDADTSVYRGDCCGYTTREILACAERKLDTED